MFGIRSIPFIKRAMTSSVSTLMVPKFHFSLMNKQSTNILLRTSLLSNNLMIHNLLQMLEKMNEEMDQDSDRDIKNLTLLNQGTLRMSHLKICRNTQ